MRINKAEEDGKHGENIKENKKTKEKKRKELGENKC
jgi:hypothetical protein